MLCFRQMKSLQKFVAVHSSVHNHFNKERHLYTRCNFKQNRHRSRRVAPPRRGLKFRSIQETESVGFNLTMPDQPILGIGIAVYVVPGSFSGNDVRRVPGGQEHG